MTGLPPPPEHVAPYVRILGTDGAVDFLLQFGGGEVYFPANPKGRSDLVRAVGQEKAAALAEELGAFKVRVPVARPWLARVMRARGLSTAEIARKLHTTDVTVRSYLKGGDPPRATDPKQLRLF